MSPAFGQERPFCLSVRYVFQGLNLGLKVKLVSADHTIVLKNIPFKRKIASQSTESKIYVKPLKTSQVSKWYLYLYGCLFGLDQWEKSPKK